MAESYVRSHNQRPRRFADPIESEQLSERRDLINELAFRLFESGGARPIGPVFSSAARKRHEELLQEVLAYINTLPRASNISTRDLSPAEYDEAVVLANRLLRFFVLRRYSIPLLLPQLHYAEISQGLTFRPLFPGCGWIEAAQGDILSGGTLFEIKAGERSFRLSDLRQLLCYCALNYSAKSMQITKVALINPRFGTYLEEDIDLLCHKISGTSSTAILSEVVDYVSESSRRY